MMKTILPVSALRRPATTTTTAALRSLHPSPSPAAPVTLLLQRSRSRRCYATQHHSTTTTTRRHAVTPFNDDGCVPWAELSPSEKTARAAQQTFNFGFVIAGMLLTGAVGYFLYQEVFSTDSKVAHFNRAVDRIRRDSRCLELLGDGSKITAFGEETANKWRMARPIASTLKKDAHGNDHLIMKFNVEGPRGRGTAHLHLTKYAGHGDFEYNYFFVDVRGHQRVYLEGADPAAQTGGHRRGARLFGINWGS